MKSFFKRFLLVVGTILLLLVGIIGLLFVPAVQRSMVHRALNSGERTVEVESVSVGLRRVQVANLSLSQPGLELTLAELDMDWSPTALLFDKAIDIRSIDVRDLNITVSETGAGDSQAAQPEGVVHEEQDLSLAGLALPEVPLTVGRLAANGKVTLASGVEVLWQAEGKDVAPGKTGALSAKGTATGNGLRTEFDASVRIDQGAARWNGAQLDARIRTETNALAAPVDLNIAASLDRNPGREDVTVVISRPTGPSAKEELFTLRASLEGMQIVRGQGAVNFDQRALAPIAGAVRLPDFAVKGDYEVTYRIPSKVGSVRVGVNGTAGNWGAVSGEYNGLPALDWQVRLSGGWDPAALQVDDLRLAAAEAGKPSSVEVALNKPFRYRLNGTDSAGTSATTAFSESVSIVFDGLSLALINPLIAPQHVDGVLTGRLSAEVDSGGDKIQIRTLERLRLTGLGFGTSEAPVIRGTTLELSPAVDIGEKKVTVTVPDVQLAAQGRSLLQGRTEIKFDRTSGNIDNASAFRMDINVLLDQPMFEQARGDVPPGEWSATVESVSRVFGDKRVAFDKLTVQVANGNTDCLALRLLQPIQFDAGQAAGNPTGSLTGLNGDIAELTISRFPLGLLEPWMQGHSLTGLIESSTIRVAKAGDDWTLITGDAPLRISGVSVASGDGDLLSNVDAVMAVTAGLSGGKMFADVGSLEVTSGGLHLLGVSGRLTLLPGEPGGAEMNNVLVNADLPRLFSQPALQSYNNFLKGTLELGVSGRVETGGRISVRLTGNDWRLREPLKTISSLGVDLTADWATDGRILLQAPMRVSGPGGTSSINLSGWLDPREGQKRFDLKLQGSKVVGDDLLLIAGAFSNPASGVDKRPATKDGAADLKGSSGTEFPFWGEWQGRLVATFEEVVHGALQIKQAEAAVDLSHKKLDVSYLRGWLSDSQFIGALAVDYRRDQRVPYDMSGGMTLQGLDVGRYLQASTGSTPVVEGMLDMKANLSGSGTDAQNLVERLKGDVDVTCTNGRMRVLAATGKDGVLGAVGILSGALSGRVHELQVVNDLLRFLEVVPYKTLSFKATRGDKLDIELTELLVLSDDLRLQGQGSIRHREGVSILNQPLQIEAHLDGKNNLAKLLNGLDLLRTRTPDASGFYSGPVFAISGTPASPNYDQLKQIIVNAGVNLVRGGRGEDLQPSAPTDQAQPETKPAPSPQEQLIRGVLQNFLSR